MYHLYRNLNVGKFANKVNTIYTITMIVAGALFPFILIDGFGTTGFSETWSKILSMSAIVNTTLFLTMAWVKKWIKKID